MTRQMRWTEAQPTIVQLSPGQEKRTAHPSTYPHSSPMSLIMASWHHAAANDRQCFYRYVDRVPQEPSHNTTPHDRRTNTRKNNLACLNLDSTSPPDTKPNRLGPRPHPPVVRALSRSPHPDPRAHRSNTDSAINDGLQTYLCLTSTILSSLCVEQ